MQTLTVSIADDHVLFTEALSTALESQQQVPLFVLDVVHSGNKLLEALDLRTPDILLLDLNMPDGDGLSVLPTIRKKYPSLKVIAMTMYDNPKFIKRALNNGALGYILKTSGMHELLKAIPFVLQNNTYLSEGLQVFPKEHSFSHEVFEDDFQVKYRLTKRETEILLLISQAKSNKEIAEELYISDQTVSVHRKNIMRKISVSNTAGLIKFAMDNIIH